MNECNENINEEVEIVKVKINVVLAYYIVHCTVFNILYN